MNIFVLKTFWGEGWKTIPPAEKKHIREVLGCILKLLVNPRQIVMEWSSKILEIHKKYKNLSFEKSISSFEKFDSVPNWHKDRTRVRIMFGTLDAVTMEQGAFKYHHYCLTLEITNRWNLMCMWIVDIKTIDVSIKSTKMLGRK